MLAPSLAAIALALSAQDRPFEEVLAGLAGSDPDPIRRELVTARAKGAAIAARVTRPARAAARLKMPARGRR